MYISEIPVLCFVFHYETKKLEKELLQSERQVKVLTEEAIKRRNDYRSYNEDFTNKMKYLEVSFVFVWMFCFAVVFN